MIKGPQENFKLECTKDKMIALTSKMYCGTDMNEKESKMSCKGIQKNNNEITYQRFHHLP